MWFERQAKLQSSSCTTENLARAAIQLFQANYSFQKPIRSLGIKASDLIDASTGLQFNFFADSARQARWKMLEGTVGKLRERFGKAAVTLATLIGADIIRESDPLTHDAHTISYVMG